MLATLLSPRTLLDPRGRCNRKGLLLIAGVLLAVEVMLGIVFLAADLRFDGPLALSLKLMLIWTAFAATSKRLHDCGHSSWWIAIAAAALMAWCFVVTLTLVFVLGPAALAQDQTLLAAMVAAVFMPLLGCALWLHCVRGDDRENAYGPPPDATGFVSPTPQAARDSPHLAASTN